MTDQNLTAVTMVLDRSGSMHTVLDDAIGGVNQVIRDQRAQKEGRCWMSIALFDHEFYWAAWMQDPAEVALFDQKSYAPRGQTALLDAIGRAVTETGAHFAQLPEDQRPGKVLVAVQTDGYENISREYTHDAVAELIKKQQDQYAWEFVFLSASLDAAKYSTQLNIPTSVYTGASGQSLRGSYTLMSAAVKSYRASGPGGMSIRGTHVDATTDGVNQGDATDTSDVPDPE